MKYKKRFILVPVYKGFWVKQVSKYNIYDVQCKKIITIPKSFGTIEEQYIAGKNLCVLLKAGKRSMENLYPLSLKEKAWCKSYFVNLKIEKINKSIDKLISKRKELYLETENATKSYMQ